MAEKIAFLGMGLMGGPMAANLAKAGHPVTVWNRTANRAGTKVAVAAGAVEAASIEEAVTDAAFVLTCLGDVPDVEEMLAGEGGVVEYAEPGTLVIDFSTIGPDAAREIAVELESADVRFLDAPVSGGDVGAIAGTLTIMVGGTESDFEAALPLFEALGSKIHHCGAVGAGQAVKLCNQVLASVHMVALTEALLLAEAEGIDPQLVVDVCKSGAAGSWALENLGPKIIARDFAPGFMIKHIQKDLRLIEETNEEADGEPLLGCELAAELFEQVAGLDDGAGALLGTQAMTRAYD